MNCVWTPEMDAQLIAGYPDVTRSTRALAAEIGVTIGSLVGRADRLGLNRTGPASVMRAIERRRVALVRKREHAERVLSSSKCCRYIYGDPLHIFRLGDARYCGEPVLPNESYCRAHFDLIYVPPTPANIILATRLAEINERKRIASEERAA